MKYRVLSNNFTITELGDGSVLLENDEKETTYVLNSMMSFIYLNCNSMSLEQILSKIKDNYDVEDIRNDEILSDIEEAIEELHNNKLIETYS